HGVLVSLGVHDFDLARYLTRSELRLEDVQTGAGSHSTSIEDSAQVAFRSLDGTIGEIHVDRTSSERRRMIVARTREHGYRGDLLHFHLTRGCLKTKRVEGVPLDSMEPLLAQAAAVSRALRGERETALATGVDGGTAVSLAVSASRLACVDVLQNSKDTHR